jgi:hypothetical protein
MSNENYAETIARMKAEAQQREMNQNLREAAAVYEEVQENEPPKR